MLIGAYSQIPHGASPQTFKRVVDCALKPILTHLYQKPWLRIHLSLSGALLECLENNYPEINMLIVDLVKKEQLEFLTGGYYQPVLHTLPAKERSLQIEKMTTIMRKRYGRRARILWCYNQIWTPALINTMHMCSLDAVVLSPYECITGQVGPTEPFRMQELGKFVTVLPSNDGVATVVQQFAAGTLDSESLIDGVRTSLTENPQAFAMLNIDQLCQGAAQSAPWDDEQVWKVFEMAFSLFPEKGTGIVQTNELYSDAFEKDIVSPLGYVASGWYGRDASPGTLHSFNEVLLDGNRLDYLHGRILALSEIVRMYRKNRDIRKYVETLLEKAVSCGGYVHDAAGGPFVGGHRKYCYHYVSAAEQQLMKQQDFSFPWQQDVDCDGNDEYLGTGKDLSGVLHVQGGCLRELVYLPTGWNYLDTCLPQFSADSRIPAGFQDMLLLNGADIEKISIMDSKDCVDLSRQDYEISLVDKKNAEFLARTEYSAKAAGQSLEVEKRFKFRTNTIIVTTKIKNLGNRPLAFKFGQQVNLALGAQGEEFSVFALSKNGSHGILDGSITKNQKSVRILDKENKTTLSLVSDVRYSLLRQDVTMPLNTVLGPHDHYQYSKFIVVWHVDIPCGAEMSYMLALKIER